MISSQPQYDRGRRAPLLAASAFSLTQLNDRPGGNIKPFCEPATVTSTPHSSWRYLIEASEENLWTILKAGGPAPAVAFPVPALRLASPLREPLWTHPQCLVPW